MGTPMNPDEDELAALLASAVHACDVGASTVDYEPAFGAVLDFIEHEPEIAATAKEMIITGVNNGTLGLELVEFLMHSLRWPEVKQAVETRLDNATDWRIKSGMSGILDSFEDDWSDAVMYQRYRK